MEPSLVSLIPKVPQFGNAQKGSRSAKGGGRLGFILDAVHKLPIDFISSSSDGAKVSNAKRGTVLFQS